MVTEDVTPKAIVLDIWFGNNSAQRPELDNAIELLNSKKIKVYAIFDTRNSKNTKFEDQLDKHAKDLYRLFYGGYLHSSIEEHGQFLLYKSNIEFQSKTDSSPIIEALPQRVARDLRHDNNPGGETLGYVLPVGDEAGFDDKTFVFSGVKFTCPEGEILPLVEEGTDSGGKFTQSGEVSNLKINSKILLIGSLEKDQPGDGLQAGPKLLAWALSDQMNNNQNAKRPLDQLTFLLGEIVFFSLFVVGIYALLFKFIKAWQTKPILLAVLSLVVGMGLMAMVAFALISLGWFMPVGLTIIAMMLAAVLSWRFAYVYLIVGVTEGSGKYDVFISYSRNDGDWVLEQLYEPLKALRKTDGSELSIFFDRKEIEPGDPFTPRYMWAIVNSRFFIPVFSENYYGAKSHGKNEMDMAYKRAIEKRITMVPITHSFDAIPEIYTHLNFIDVKEQADFFQIIEASILKEG